MEVVFWSELRERTEAPQFSEDVIVEYALTLVQNPGFEDADHLCACDLTLRL